MVGLAPAASSSRGAIRSLPTGAGDAEDAALEGLSLLAALLALEAAGSVSEPQPDRASPRTAAAATAPVMPLVFINRPPWSGNAEHRDNTANLSSASEA